MVRETSDDHSGGATLSSIALLQERFKQLQRMKELRKEKELLRTLVPHEQRSETLISGSQQMSLSPPTPYCQLSLSLWPDNSQTKHTDSRGIKAPSNLAKSLFTDSPTFKLQSSDHIDIDTSLHL